MFQNPTNGRPAGNFRTNVPKILDLKSSSAQIFSENWRWVPLTFGRLHHIIKKTDFKLAVIKVWSSEAPCKRAQYCWMLHVASVCTPCCMLFRVVAQSLKPFKRYCQQLPTFLLFCDSRSVAQQCWIRLHGSSNIVGATHANYAWITKTYGSCSSHDALQVPNLLGIVASVCTPLPTWHMTQLTFSSNFYWNLL